MRILVSVGKEIIICVINYKKFVNQNIFKNEGRRPETVCALEPREILRVHERVKYSFYVNVVSKDYEFIII